MLVITKANVSGFSAPQDEALDQTYINSAYEALDVFSIDLVFQGAYDDGDGDGSYPEDTDWLFANALNVTSTFDWASIGLTYSKPNAYTVRLTGPAKDVFTGQYYKFKMVDGSEKVLQPDTTDPFLSIIRYKMPSPTYIMKTYPFTVTIPAALDVSIDPTTGLSSGGGYNAGPYYTSGGALITGTTETVSVDMKQWFYWRYEVAQANIEAAVARGLR